MATNDKRARQGEVDQDHPAQRIEEDHRTLRSRLDALAAATTRTALLEGLLALPELLHEHFVREEEFDGLFDDLRTRRPSMAPRLDALSDEHRVILEELDALSKQLKGRMDAERAVEQISEPMMKDVAHWLERMRRHEHEESRMISDVYYTDEGGHG